MSPSVGAQIVAKFGPKADDPEIITKCKQLIDLFGLSSEELFLKWETYVVTTSTVEDNIQLSVENLTKLQDYIQKQIVKENQKTSTNDAHAMRPVIRGTPNSSMTNIVVSSPVSSTRKRRKLETPHAHRSDMSDDSSFFSARSTSSPLVSSDHEDSPSKSHMKQSGSILETLNGEILSNTDSKANPIKPKLVASFDPAKYKFRTMNQKLLEVADYLDDQIDRMAQVILEQNHFETSDFGNPCLQSQTEILAVGRIVPDSPSTDFDADLNSNSLFFETSRSGGIGQRVRLGLNKLKDYSLFPGQIACFRGMNQTGDLFVVSQQYQIPFLGSPVSALTDLESYQAQLADSPAMKVVVTSGPYCPSREMNFELLAKFVDRMNNEVKPSSIIMFGPFIDVNHRQIREGTLNFPGLDPQPQTLDEVFKMVVAPILRRLTCQQVILIPSTKDVTTDHAAYPQKMFERKHMGLKKNFKCFPDPATFSLNEVFIGCSNNDVFRDLKDVNFGQPLLESRFNRVSEHVLEQRRYYPSFPGGMKRKHSSVLSSTDFDNQDQLYTSGADLHASYMGLAEFPDSLPDILIIPSELKHFAKVVKNVLILNPGNFIKMNRNGSYALISVKKPDITDFSKVGENRYLNNIWKRARVDIFRS